MRDMIAGFRSYVPSCCTVASCRRVTGKLATSWQHRQGSYWLVVASKSVTSWVNWSSGIWDSCQNTQVVQCDCVVTSLLCTVTWRGCVCVYDRRRRHRAVLRLSCMQATSLSPVTTASTTNITTTIIIIIIIMAVIMLVVTIENTRWSIIPLLARMSRPAVITHSHRRPLPLLMAGAAHWLLHSMSLTLCLVSRTH